MKTIALLTLLIIISCGKGGSGAPESTTTSCTERKTCITGTYGITDGDESTEFIFTETTLEVYAYSTKDQVYTRGISVYHLSGNRVVVDGFNGNCVDNGPNVSYKYELDGDKMRFYFNDDPPSIIDLKKRAFDKQKVLETYSLSCSFFGL